jgi:hypothetical protein
MLADSAAAPRRPAAHAGDDGRGLAVIARVAVDVSETVVPVRCGSTFFLYTDGLVEGRDLPLDDGIARLGSVLAELRDRPLGALCDEVIQRPRRPAER